jgi:2-amino-4-hydroxy-6-hydroxymethyldihydropteridine diphosphokinase
MGVCAIGLGSNLGDSRSILISAIERLRSHSQIELVAISSWYKTAPIGPPQPDYLNGCATLQTSLEPLDLLNVLHSIEADLLLYDDLIIDLPTLQVPHPRMIERAFVLVPLNEIAPDAIEPRSGQSIATLCSMNIGVLPR